MKRSQPLRRTPFKRNPSKAIARASHPAGKDADFTDATRDLVRRRCAGKCELAAPGCWGTGTQFHHRQLRRGGNHSPQNCLLLCLSCHNWVHAHVKTSLANGWLVSQYDDPATVTWASYQVDKP